MNDSSTREGGGIRSAVSTGGTRARCAARVGAGLLLGALSTSAAPARADTFVVNVSDDLVTTYPCAGHCSLREALIRANASAERDHIVFSIGSGGARRITVTSSSLRVTRPVVIDATTQPGYDGTPLIELRGPGPSDGGTQISGIVLEPGSAGSEISGFAINNFNVSGIVIRSSDNLLTGNFIGTNRTGTAALPNRGSGISIGSGAVGNLIGGSREGEGNVVSGNGDTGGFPAPGVAIASGDNVLFGNLIGTAKDGVTPIPNSGEGVRIAPGGVPPSNNLIGDVAPGFGNVIAFNARAGVSVERGNQNAILGNAIFENDRRGIELVDTAANRGLGAPVLTSATVMWVLVPNPMLPNAPMLKRVLRVTGSVSAVSFDDFSLDLYSNASCGTDPIANAKGERYELTRAVRGASAFQFDLAPRDWDYLTATVRSAVNDTSAFSNCIAVASIERL